MLYPVELRAHEPSLAHRDVPSGLQPRTERHGRGRGIRTLDIQLPKLALYQAELYPAVAVSVVFAREDDTAVTITLATVACRAASRTSFPTPQRAAP